MFARVVGAEGRLSDEVGRIVYPRRAGSDVVSIRFFGVVERFVRVSSSRVVFGEVFLCVTTVI